MKSLIIVGGVSQSFDITGGFSFRGLTLNSTMFEMFASIKLGYVWVENFFVVVGYK